MKSRNITTAFLFILATFAVTSTVTAQERPVIEVRVVLEKGSLSTTFGGDEFVPQRSEPLNKMLDVRLTPFQRLSFNFRTDIGGRINAPTFQDAQGRDVVKQYDSYEGRDSVMEGTVSYRVLESVPLDVIGGYSIMKHEEDYTTGQNVGLPPLRTTSERKFSSILVGVGTSREWNWATLTAQALYYPSITREHKTTQDYQEHHFDTKMEPQDGSGVDLRAGLEIIFAKFDEDEEHWWGSLTAGVTYQWRQINSHRLSAQNANTALLVDEKTRVQYLGFHVGFRF